MKNVVIALSLATDNPSKHNLQVNNQESHYFTIRNPPGNPASSLLSPFKVLSVLGGWEEMRMCVTSFVCVCACVRHIPVVMGPKLYILV